MSNAFNEITETLMEVAMVPPIIFEFVACMPWWLSAGIGFSVVCGALVLLFKIVTG